MIRSGGWRAVVVGGLVAATVAVALAGCADERPGAATAEADADASAGLADAPRTDAPVGDAAGPEVSPADTPSPETAPGDEGADAPTDTPSTAVFTVITPTSGGGAMASTTHRLVLGVGTPQPMGRATSSTIGLHLGPVLQPAP